MRTRKIAELLPRKEMEEFRMDRFKPVEHPNCRCKIMEVDLYEQKRTRLEKPHSDDRTNKK